MNNKILTQLILNLEDIKEPGEIKTKDAKVISFSILSTKRKTIIRLKRKMSYEIKNEFRTFGIQNFELFEKLNPVNIQIRDHEINSKLTKYSNKRYQYRFIIKNLLLSPSIEQDANVIFLMCKDLNDTKESLINGKLYKTLGVVNTAKIKDWNKLKGQSKWINIVFKDSENPTVAKHFAFVFETINFTDLLNFQLALADDEAKLIKLKDGETKVPGFYNTNNTIKKMKVKKTTYQSSSSKNNEIIKITNEIKNAMLKIEEKKNKTVDQYSSLIQSIKKRISKS